MGFRLKYFRNTPKSHELFYSFCSTLQYLPVALQLQPHLSVILIYYASLLWLSLQEYYDFVSKFDISMLHCLSAPMKPFQIQPFIICEAAQRVLSVLEKQGNCLALQQSIHSAFLKLDLEGFAPHPLRRWEKHCKVKRCSATSAAPVGCLSQDSRGSEVNCGTGKRCNESRRKLLYSLYYITSIHYTAPNPCSP